MQNVLHLKLGMHIILHLNVLEFWFMMHVACYRQTVIPNSGNLVISCCVQKLYLNRYFVCYLFRRKIVFLVICHIFIETYPICYPSMYGGQV